MSPEPDHPPAASSPPEPASNISVGDIQGATGVAIGPGATSIVHLHHDAAVPERPGSAPPMPALIVGRDDDLRELRARLLAQTREAAGRVQVLTAVRGWPGVGKTTLAAALAQDTELRDAYPDGVLWVTLGTDPQVLGELAAWGRAIGIMDLITARSADEASARLRAALRSRRYLLLIDDAWDIHQAQPFLIGGPGCATLVTTREQVVALALAPTPAQVYRLGVLKDEPARALLRLLAPTVVDGFPAETQALVGALEGLPLALQVAGRLLHAEMAAGFGIVDLLAELQQGARLLDARVPEARPALARETSLTVTVLLQKSTDRLDPLARRCFAFLGPFAPKPATFDLEALQAVWQVADPKPIIKALVDRGLLEFVPELERYQMHGLLVLHARSLLSQI